MIADLEALACFVQADHSLVALRDEVARRLDDDPGHDLAHAMRVALWTIRLGGDGVDARCAVAAALLHDVVNVPKDDPSRHLASERSATLARRLLPGFGFVPEAVDDVCAAIRDHSFSRGARPERLLGQALQDADRLESLGAIGLLRVASTGARMGARYFHPEDPWAKERPLDDLAYSVDHFYRKLFRLPATMNTEAGRREAERRTAFLRTFLEQLGEELGEPPPAPTERAR